MKKVFGLLVIILSLSLLVLAGCKEQQIPAVQETPEPVVEDAVEPKDVQTDASSVAAPEEPAAEPEPEVPPAPSCGDGLCNGAENCDRCIKDCGCVSPAECYHGICKVPECGSNGDCKDDDPCTVDVCYFVQHPNAYCAHEVIEDPKNNDKCCPVGENANTDSDCLPVCDNNVCEMGENENNCEEDCPDQQATNR